MKPPAPNSAIEKPAPNRGLAAGLKAVTGLLLALCLLCPGWANAQAPVSVPVPFVRQHSAVWCWVAVAEMALRYKTGNSLPQCRLAELTFGAAAGACCGSGGCQQGASLDQIQVLLNGLGLKTQQSAPVNDPRRIYALFRQGKPIIVRLVRRDSGVIRIGPKPMGHVVVLRGMRLVQPPPGSPLARQGIMLALLLINDPSFPGPIEVPYPDVASNWERFLVVE